MNRSGNEEKTRKNEFIRGSKQIKFFFWGKSVKLKIGGYFVRGVDVFWISQFYVICVIIFPGKDPKEINEKIQGILYHILQMKAQQKQ